MRWTETQPGSLIFTAADIARHVNAENDEYDDADMDLMQGAAIAFAETAMGRSLMQRTITATFYANPCPADLLYLPRGPIISITSVTPEGATALATSAYKLEYVGNACARLRVNGALAYPTNLTVVYEAGYATATAIPADIRQAVKMHAGQLWTIREPIVIGTTVANVPNSLSDFYQQRTWEMGVG